MDWRTCARQWCHSKCDRPDAWASHLDLFSIDGYLWGDNNHALWRGGGKQKMSVTDLKYRYDLLQ